MTDSPAEAAAPVAAETYSAEFVADLKKQLEAKTTAEAAMKARFQNYELREREKLKAMQGDVLEMIKEGIDNAGEHKHEVQPLLEFGEKLHEAANIDSAMPLARMITTWSGTLKRTRAEFSQSKEATELLAKANGELDELRADRDQKASRIAELEALAAERLTASEKLQEELAKAGVLKETFEFSKASAREASPAATTGGASGSVVPKAAAFTDPLLAFVSNGATGGARLMPASSNHAILGMEGGMDSIANAIRMA